MATPPPERAAAAARRRVRGERRVSRRGAGPALPQQHLVVASMTIKVYLQIQGY
jgi:hypothetical protein